MKFTSGFAAVLAFAGLALAETPNPPDDLVIDRTHVPENCAVTAQAGDSIQVHYKGTLFANGNKFDSR
jgi:FK506-binding protein 2